MAAERKGNTKKHIELLGIDSVILGRIMAAQNVLFVLPTRKKITDFYANLLSCIPGVKACIVCLGNSYTQVGENSKQKCSICENTISNTDEDFFYSKNIVCKFKQSKHSYVFPLDTIDHRFGFFVFTIDRSELFELYKPFIDNLGNFVALSLENRLQRNNLQKAHDDLEKKVKKRTTELNSINIQLEKELNEKKRTEQQFESQYTLLSSLINSSQNIIIFSLDKDYCYTAFNEKHFEEMKKIWNVEIKIGMNLLDCMTIPELKAIAKNSIDRTLKGETVSEIQHQPDAEIYYEFLWNPVIQNKKITGVTAFIQNITEREKSKIKILESEQLFRALVEKSPDFISRYDREFRRIYVNPAIQKLFKDRTENVLGKTPSDQSPLYAPKIYIDHLQQVFDTAVETAAEIPFKTSKDEMHWGHIRFVPELDSEGKVSTVMAIGRDIHEIKENEQRFRMLAENFPDFVFRFDSDCKYIYINPAVEKAFGILSNDFIGKTIQELPLNRKPELNKSIIELIQHTFIEDTIIDSETFLDTQIGERLFELRYVSEKDATGNIVSVLCIAHDITERNIAEKMLYKERNLLRIVIDNLPDGVWTKDLNYRKTLANRSDVQMMGLKSEEQVLGKDDYELYPKELAKGFMKDDRSVIQTGMPVIDREEYVCDEKGQKHFLLTTKLPFRNEMGKIIGIIGISHDITERKKAEEQIFHSAQRLRLHAEQSPLGFLEWDENFCASEWNAACEKIFGYTREEAVGKHAKDLILPEEVKGLVGEIFNNLMNQVGGQHSINKNITKDGHIIICEWFNTTLVNNNGKPIGVASICNDITERKQMEEALAESEREFRSLAENSPDNIIRYDRQCRAIYCNKKAFTIEPEKVLGKTPVELGASSLENDTKYEEHVRGVLVSGNSSELELHLLGPDGEVKNHMIRFVPERDQDGNIYGVLAIGQDITKRKRTEEALKAREMELQNLADSSPGLMGTFYRRPDGSVCMPYTSPQLHELFGLDPKDVKDDATPLLSRTHPDDKQMVNYTIAESSRTMTPWHCEYRIIHPTRGELWVEGSTNPKPHPNGGVIWYGFVHDITKRKMMEKEIFELNLELEQRVINRTLQLESANTELEAFAYSVSHDLRAPLRGIDGFSLILLEDYQEKLDLDGKNYLNRIRAASQRMAVLIDDLLKLSKINREVMNIGAVDLSKIAQKIINELKESQPKRKVGINIQDGMRVKGDERLIQIAIENLIGNAWKFTSKHESANIEFGMLIKEGKPIYFIKDDGAGFDMKYSQNLFGAFQRFHTSNEFPGTGIGLATVQRIIHRHGGNIWAKSEVEKGSTFYFTIKEE